MMLMRKAKSWFTGYNSNVPGHEQGTIRYLVYNGGAPKYVDAINNVTAKGYEGIVLTADARAAALLAPPAGKVGSHRRCDPGEGALREFKARLRVSPSRPVSPASGERKQ